MKIARYYEKIKMANRELTEAELIEAELTEAENGSVRCLLCPHGCLLKNGSTGICRARKNIGGELFSLNYGRVSSIALDPVEKKPLYRFHPGSYIVGRDIRVQSEMLFLPELGISHDDPRTAGMEPDMLVDKAVALVTAAGNIGLAFTYNEPSIWYEYVSDTARLAKKQGLAVVLVTNGFINGGPLEELLPFVDAMNIDVKAFTEGFYKNICGGSLDVVKKTVETAARSCHVEVTTLVIPGLNDTVEEINDLSRWLASISTEIPLHLSRFFPAYKMSDKPPTPVSTLINARDTALKHLRYVYIGNV